MRNGHEHWTVGSARLPYIALAFGAGCLGASAADASISILRKSTAGEPRDRRPCDLASHHHVRLAAMHCGALAIVPQVSFAS